MPDWPEEVRRAIAGLNLEPTREAEVVEELSQHLQDRFEEMMERGDDASHAYSILLKELQDGGLLQGLRLTMQKRQKPIPAEGGGAMKWAKGLSRDLRYAARQLYHSPGFTLVAVLSLALGVGANTAIFQLLDAVRLRTLPVHAPEELASINIGNAESRSGSFVTTHPDLTYPIWKRAHDQQQGFSGFAAWAPSRDNLNHGGEARYAQALQVSGEFFPLLGVGASLGRLLGPADDHIGCATPGVVLSYSFWQSEYGGRSSVLGGKLMLDGKPYQIVGVTAPSFHGVDVGSKFDVAVPFRSECSSVPTAGQQDDKMLWWLAGIGRLKPGWTLKQASAQLASVSPGIFAATVPDGYDSITRKSYLRFRLQAIAAGKGVSNLRGDHDPLPILLGLSSLVLLLACANLANLLLARASARQREMALRLTLGASRGRLIRQAFSESLLLAVLGTGLGLALAQFLSRTLITALNGSQQTIFLEMKMNWHVLGFAAGLALLTCLLFGLTPALQASRTDPGVVMKAAGRGMTSGRERFLLRRILVITQVALSLVLLTGALLFVRSFRNVMSVDMGFQQDHVLVASFDYSPLHLPVERRGAFQQDLLTRIQAIPGVQAASQVAIVPVSNNGWDMNVDIPGGLQRQDVNFNRVSPEYFSTLHISWLMGRNFDGSDTLHSQRVAVVNEAFVKKFMNGANPSGKIVQVSERGGDKKYQIVGAVKNTKYFDLREDFMPIMYLPSSQDEEPGEGATFVVQSNIAVDELIDSLKHTSDDVNHSIVLNFQPLKEQIDDHLTGDRVMALLTSFFGALAILLAVIGIYGVISYMVIRRRNEIGVRMALGAARGNILGMIVREAAVLLAIGALIGSGLAWAAGTIAQAQLYGVKGYDPATLTISILGLALVVLLASFFPARKAASVDPMVALREE